MVLLFKKLRPASPQPWRCAVSPGLGGGAPASFFIRFRLRLCGCVRAACGAWLCFLRPARGFALQPGVGSARPGPPGCSPAPACELLLRVLSSEVVSAPLVAGAHARLRLSLIVRHSFFCATVQPPPPAPRSSDLANELIFSTIGF